MGPLRLNFRQLDARTIADHGTLRCLFESVARSRSPAPDTPWTYRLLVLEASCCFHALGARADVPVLARRARGQTVDQLAITRFELHAASHLPCYGFQL